MKKIEPLYKVRSRTTEAENGTVGEARHSESRVAGGLRAEKSSHRVT